MSPFYTVVLFSEDEALLKEAAEKMGTYISVFTANFLAECEYLAIENNTKVIAIDTRVAGNRGLESCRALRRNEALVEKSIILLSGADDLETKIKALAAGCDKFLHYPTQKDAIVSEIQSTVDKKEELKKLRQEKVSLASEFQSIDIHQFFDICFRCQSLSELAEAYLSSVSPLVLDTSVYLAHSTETVVKHASGQDINDEDRIILKNLANKPEVSPLGHSLSVSFIGTSSVTKSMPVDNIRLYDYIKETLTLLLHALSVRVQALEFRTLYQLERESSQSILSLSEQVFSQMSFELLNSQKNSQQLGDNFEKKLERILKEEGSSTTTITRVLSEAKTYNERVLDGLSEGAKVGTNKFQGVAKKIKKTFQSDSPVERSKLLEAIRGGKT